MKKFNRQFAALGAGALLALSLTACGSDEEENPRDDSGGRGR